MAYLLAALFWDGDHMTDSDKGFEHSVKAAHLPIDQTPTDVLVLESLHQGIPGLTKAWGQFLCEASACCIEFHRHPKGVELKIQGVSDTPFNIHWENNITDQTQDAWNDNEELTEYGACGIAILLILKLTSFTVIQRARKGTGIDYWLGYKNAEKPFQNAARLEVSGILSGNTNVIKARVNKKRKQTEPTDGALPAFIAVVEFSEPLAHLVQK